MFQKEPIQYTRKDLLRKELFLQKDKYPCQTVRFFRI